MGLQNAFYIIGIIFMSLMLLILMSLVAAVFMIKAKVNHIHNQIEERLHNVTSLVSKAEAVGNKALSAAKKVIKK